MQALAETLAEDSHERWARELKCSSPDCHAHPSFVPYVLLDEKKKEELRTYALDLMRYLKVSGFETSRTYRSMSVVMSSSGGDQRYRLMLAWNYVQYFILYSSSMHKREDQIAHLANANVTLKLKKYV